MIPDYHKPNRWIVLLFTLLLVLSTLLVSCKNNEQEQKQAKEPEEAKPTSIETFQISTETPPMGKSDGVYYEIFVRSFSDSNGDGIGDLQGVTNKMDYLEDLGIKGIWLMPIQPSPSYHGYDVTDYYNVNPDYGTMDDLKKLTDEAHRRGIKVIIDLLVNHTSNQHPWFVESAKDKDSPYRGWFTWAEDQGIDTNESGPWGQQVWHKSGDSTYLGVFWGGMPDLNMDLPEVRKELIQVGQFWLKQGLDGFRLDAAKHVYEDFQSSTNDPEVSDKNKAWWQEFRQGMEQENPNVYLIGEIWDSASVVAPFLDNAMHSGFNFDTTSLLISAAITERAPNLASTLNRIYELYAKQSDGQFVDAPFINNHDRVRSMSEMQGDVEHVKMAASMLLTLPGNPFLYYGEEIGMSGTKPDEQLREPMNWSADGKAPGQTTWEPELHKLDGFSVEEQLNDPNSILNHYKQMISWRNQEPILGDGGIVDFPIANDSILGFIRVQEEAKVLVIHNLSDEPQEIDLNANGSVPFNHIALSSKEGVQLIDGQLQIPPYTSVLLNN